MDNLIIYLAENGVLSITLNRLSKKNALTSAMYEQLTQQLNSANHNSDIRCILLQGNEQCFCAGNDLQDFVVSSADDDLAAFGFINALADLEKPLVVAVAGPAVGIGTTILLHADFIIAADNSKFCLPFNQLGLCPEAASSVLLPKLVGHAKAFELLTLGDTFDAHAALSYQLVNRVCSPNELLEQAKDVADRIAALPHDALITTRSLLKHHQHALIKQTMAKEASEFSRLMQSQECQAILAKFFS